MYTCNPPSKQTHKEKRPTRIDKRTRSLFYRCALPSHRPFRFNMFKCATNFTIPAPRAQPNTSTVELLSSGTHSLTSLCTTRTNTSSHVVKCDCPKLHYAFPRINAVRGWIHYPTDNSCTSRRVQLGRKYHGRLRNSIGRYTYDFTCLKFNSVSNMSDNIWCPRIDSLLYKYNVHNKLNTGTISNYIHKTKAKNSKYKEAYIRGLTKKDFSLYLKAAYELLLTIS